MPDQYITVDVEKTIALGRKLHADLIAWIKVQKVSNLILNMNVYSDRVLREIARPPTIYFDDLIGDETRLRRGHKNDRIVRHRHL